MYNAALQLAHSTPKKSTALFDVNKSEPFCGVRNTKPFISLPRFWQECCSLGRAITWGKLIVLIYYPDLSITIKTCYSR
ncbi:hypothetical protein S7335_2203 [Synechococcus sp. PCC 7335]|nr:hypothetical protein S7335_2203 [Synechococcus sp. PCC 7335]